MRFESSFMGPGPGWNRAILKSGADSIAAAFCAFTVLAESGRKEYAMNNSVLVPMVVEQTSRGERAYDIYSATAQGEYYFPGHAD